jgi:hypothetical protein
MEDALQTVKETMQTTEETTEPISSLRRNTRGKDISDTWSTLVPGRKSNSKDQGARATISEVPAELQTPYIGEVITCLINTVYEMLILVYFALEKA